MATVAGSIEISRAIEDVFDFVADETNEPRYNVEMTRCEKVTPGHIGVGTRYEAELVARRRVTPVTIEVTEFERPHRLASTTRIRNMDIFGAVSFEPVPEGTLMTWHWDLKPRGLMRWLGPLVTLMGRRQEQRIWTSLKSLLEVGASPASPAAS